MGAEHRRPSPIGPARPLSESQKGAPPLDWAAMPRDRRPRWYLSPHTSKGDINRAGECLREWAQQPLPPGATSEDFPEDVLGAYALVFFAYRPTFQTPMDKVHMQLARWAKKVAGDPGASKRVGQRLKRELPIIRKLARLKKMELARMEDIAGCRVVLSDQDQVWELADQIQDSWDIKDYKDYVAIPTKWGYRAVHLAVLRDERLIEIQLRTPAQHSWAWRVERFGHEIRQDLKWGKGPPEVLRYFQLASHGVALEERGEEPDQAFSEAFAEARAQVDRYRQGR
jgi:putative GTP pyrophosphokinase